MERVNDGHIPPLSHWIDEHQGTFLSDMTDHNTVGGKVVIITPVSTLKPAYKHTHIKTYIHIYTHVYAHTYTNSKQVWILDHGTTTVDCFYCLDSRSRHNSLVLL